MVQLQVFLYSIQHVIFMTVPILSLVLTQISLGVLYSSFTCTAAQNIPDPPITAQCLGLRAEPRI